MSYESFEGISWLHFHLTHFFLSARNHRSVTRTIQGTLHGDLPAKRHRV